MQWMTSAAHVRWLEIEADRVFDFGRASRVSTGFGWLDDQGTLATEAATQLWITSRMVHVYSAATLMGRPGAADLADHGISALQNGFWDAAHGGWFSSITDEGPEDPRKAGYAHAFVLLCAASATAAGRPGGEALLERAVDVFEQHFWREEENGCLESWDERFQTAEPYRGGNMNMHAAEAFLSVADVTGEVKWLERALAIAERMIHHVARHHEYRVVEHFDERWTPMPEYNKKKPADRFRAYGSMPGHGMEWARVLLSLRHSLLDHGLETPTWLGEDAQGLFHAALRDGWQSEGHPGLVYTVDWKGRPVVNKRVCWAVAESIGAAATLFRETGDPDYEQWYQRFWDYARTYLMDFDGGAWHQELDSENRISSEIWTGKPDIYHLMHCLVVPRLPSAPALVPALARGRLDEALK